MFRNYKILLMLFVLFFFTRNSTAQLKMEKLGTFTADADFAESGSEIIAFDETSNRVFSTNGFQNRIDIIDASDPTNPTFVNSIDVSLIGDGVQSVAVSGGIVAVAISNADGMQNGFVGFFDTDGIFKSSVEVGVLPDAVTFSPDGNTVITSNEGEPSDDYLQDPKGSISIIDVSVGIDAISQANVTTLSFDEYNNNYDRNIRVFGVTQPFLTEFLDTTLEANGVKTYNNASDKDWRLSSRDGIFYAEINGFRGDVASNDWLVVDSLDLATSGHEHAYLSFLNERRFNGNGMEVLASTDFAGDVNTATWVNIEDNKSISMMLSAASDDTEEYVDGPNQTETVGSNDFGSSDLEFNSERDGMTRPQAVAVRFDNVQIQKGATVKNAYVQFTVDEAAKNDGECSVDILVEANENASTFDGTDSLVANRTKMKNPNASDLIISEVAEGSSYNKYMEIYNGTGSAIDLSDYALANVGNAPRREGEHEFWRDFDSGAVIPAGGTYIIADDRADSASIVSKADEFHNFLSNGDDGYCLVKGNNWYGPTGKWKPVSIAVGPGRGRADYFAFNYITNAARNSVDDDRIVFNLDGTFENEFGADGRTWIENWFDGAGDRDAEPSTPFNNPAGSRWQKIGTDTIRIIGAGSYIGLQKTVNGGEFGNDVAWTGVARDTLEYLISSENPSITETLVHFDIQVGGGNWWRFTYSDEGQDIYFPYAKVDCVGDFMGDPGSGWDVAGVNNGTKDHTLIRKSSVADGNGGNWTASAGTSAENSEWIVKDKDDWNDIAKHATDIGKDMSVRWTIAANTWQTADESGADQQTVDISKLVQSVIDMPDWEAGNAIALYFMPAGIDQGIRVAKSADDAPDEAAELHLEFDGGVINWSDNNEWQWTESGYIDISEHISDNTAIAFHYTGGNGQGDGSGSWYRISDIEIAQQDLANDLEPEYSVVGSDNNTVYTVAQENNAMIVSTINPPAIYGIYPLGTKDHSAPGNGLDPTNDDGGINIGNFPLNGMYMPDGMAVANIGGNDYVFTANEGDAREYEDLPGLIEEVDLIDGGNGLVGQGYMDMDDNDTADNGTEDWYTQWGGDDKLNDMSYPVAFNAHTNGVTAEVNLYGDTDGDGLIEELHSYGARSFTIWDNRLAVIYDSKDEFEQNIAKEHPDNFGNDNDEQDFEGRSDNKGPEPESVAVGQLGDKYFAFIGLERAGGIMVYDVTDPANSKYVMYELNRDVTLPIEEQGDLGPEDVKFVSAENSPNGKAMVIVSNEVSNTVTFYNVEYLTGNIEDINDKDVVKIAPNPSNGLVNLYVHNAIKENYNVEVYNLVGTVVYSESNIHGGVTALDLNHLDKGVYIISVGNNKVSSKQRVVLK